MTFRGEVVGLESKGVEAEVVISNLRRKAAAEWREYSSEARFRIPLSSCKAFAIGRIVIIELRV
jgi:hypothetical protein